MHCALEGTVKKLLELWFKSSNHKYQFYMDSKIKHIDNLLLKIQYPSELPRTQRSIINYNLFKANECRNLIYYGLIYVLKDFMETSYYEHLINYILFIRILTQDYVDNNDIIKSKLLINQFVKNFEKLYGSTNSSFNLHSHLHLPDQVAIYGPLNKISCFPFEGVFKICHNLFFGTVNIAEQIAANLKLITLLNNTDIVNQNLIQFMNDSNFQEINHSDVNKILFPKQISINNLRDVERKLLNPLVTKDIIITGKRALINCKKFSTNTDNKNFKTQNFTIRYLNSTSYKYGILRNFYNINNVIYALVQTFRKAQNFVSDQTIEEHLNKYFLICHLSEEYEIIHYKNIDTKCVILKNQNEYFISVCNLLNEHD